MAKAKNKKQIKKWPILLLLLIIAGLLIYRFLGVAIKKGKLNIGQNLFSYSTKYEEYVTKYSEKFDIDPAFVYAVINTESHFDPKATSDVGARGLMQLMEEAYDWVKYRLNDDRDHTYDDMYDPELNIEYGTYMLKYLYDKYDSYELAAAAYHGGMGAVDGWIEDGTVNQKNFNLDDIPSEVTANYVYKVTTAYNKYRELLKED